MAVHPESLLISAVVRTGEFQTLAAHGITLPMFHAHPDEAEWLFRFIAAHGKAPSKAALRNTWPEFVVYAVDDTAYFCSEVRISHKEHSVVDMTEAALLLLDNGEPDKALDTLQKGVQFVRSTEAGVRSDFDVFENWEEVYDAVKARHDRVRSHGFAGVPTGFTTFDSITGGTQPGWFGVTAARLGEGKTWTGIKMAWSGVQSQRKIIYFSLEQPRLQIAMRVHAFASRQYHKEVFNPQDLNRGRGFDLRSYRQFLSDLKEKRGSSSFKINDTSRGRVNIDTVASVIEQEQPDHVLLDYLTLLSTDSDDWRGTAKLSGSIQATSHRYDVPITALSQVNRLGIGKDAPGAEHLSQADAIGQDADWVMTLKQMSQNVMKHRLAKFRHGEGGATWWSKFSPGSGEYEEITHDDAVVQMEADGELD